MSFPAEIVAKRRSGRTVLGWKLDPECRTELLAVVRPRYGNVVADHVTLATKFAPGSPPPDNVTATAIGRADDGRGVEAVVVQIDGDTRRPDGGVYHITWSLGLGRKAVESNDVIAERGWQALDQLLPLSLTPARF